MARKRFHGLKKVKVRASWNKYNLYNLSRLKTPNTSFQTYYQQKWSSKSITRAYHGEQIREKQWQRMFTSKLDAVIPMNHRYLAENDGSELASGRGSGSVRKPVPRDEEELPPSLVPYMNMTYAPIERRLDMAIFRALFASSARQARQFVVHGRVKVNGKKMAYPGYLLNPGDMFQVEVDSVLFATGARKEPSQRREARRLRRIQKNRNVGLEKVKAAGMEKRAARQAEKEATDRLAKPKKPLLQDSLTERNAIKKDLQAWIDEAEQYLNASKNRLRRRVKFRSSKAKTKERKDRIHASHAKNRQNVRNFKRNLKNLMGRVYRLPVQELDVERLALIAQQGHYLPSQQGRASLGRVIKTGNIFAYTDKGPKHLQVGVRQRVESFLKERQAERDENPIDPTKPYATPWKPRPYMSAFAFIPRYLEVNQNICAAVYLRHPVARPSMAEVPSPFPFENQQLAFNWYLRRR